MIERYGMVPRAEKIRTETIREVLREDWRSLIPAAIGALVLLAVLYADVILAFCFGGPR
jgi:hypothetical protein